MVAVFYEESFKKELRAASVLGLMLLFRMLIPILFYLNTVVKGITILLFSYLRYNMSHEI